MTDNDDDIRQALHATYVVAGRAPTFAPDAFKQRATRARPRPLVASLIALVVTVVVAVPVGVGVLLHGGLNGGSSGSSLSVLDLHMYGPDDGWAWSGGDDILHTTSGVAHWTVVPPPIGNELIAGLAWVDGDSARLLAAPGDSYNELEQTYTVTPWATDDGGGTWTKGQPFRVLLEAGADPTNGSAYADLDFVDPMHGWFFDNQATTIGGPTFIYRTVDGGQHWSQVEMTPATGSATKGSLPVGCSMYGMTFASSVTGWVAGSCGLATLFDVTHDGGLTWAPQSFPCSDCALYPPQFTSALDGVVFGENGEGVLFTTDDGGRTWTARDEPTGLTPDFVDATHGFTMGLTGNDNPAAVLWLTTDGGATWRQAANGAIHGNGPYETSQLDFIDPTTGWSVSLYETSGGGLLTNGQTPYPTPPPELWQTNDAGSTWTQITPTFTSSK
jgi:photosystem II stability/assembly factor-like uncharacterized protein